MKMILMRWLVVVPLLLPAACVATGGATTGGSRNVIPAEELLEFPHNTLFDAVRALRPRWLQGRTGTSLRSPGRQTPRVYVDGQSRGGIGEMRSMLPGEVGTIRFMSPTDATTRFGTNHIAGAIVITTKQRLRIGNSYKTTVGPI